eukprot:4473065-Pyramimonas_sp.AAC.1
MQWRIRSGAQSCLSAFLTQREDLRTPVTNLNRTTATWSELHYLDGLARPWRASTRPPSSVNALSPAMRACPVCGTWASPESACRALGDR